MNNTLTQTVAQKIEDVAFLYPDADEPTFRILAGVQAKKIIKLVLQEVIWG